MTSSFCHYPWYQNGEQVSSQSLDVFDIVP